MFSRDIPKRQTMVFYTLKCTGEPLKIFAEDVTISSVHRFQESITKQEHQIKCARLRIQILNFRKRKFLQTIT